MSAKEDSIRRLRKFPPGALFCLALIFFLPATAHAANRYWVGGSDGANVNVAANWSASSGNACGVGGGSSVPGASDIAYFAGDCVNSADIDLNWSIAGIDIHSLYAGTLFQSGSNTLTVGSSHYNQEGGTFAGGSASITINGTYTLSGSSTFTATSGTMTVTNTFINSSSFNAVGGSKIYGEGGGCSNINFTNTGTYDAGTSTTAFNGRGGTVIAGGAKLNSVSFSPSYGCGVATLGDNLTVNGNLTIGDQGSSFGGNTVYLTGNFTQNASVTGGGTLTLSGASNQTLTQTSGSFPIDLTVAKSSGSAVLGSNFTATGDMTVNAGSVFDTSSDGGTTDYNLTVTAFSNAGTFYARSGSHSYGVGACGKNFVNTGTYNVGTSTTSIGMRGGSVTTNGIKFNNLTIAPSYGCGGATLGDNLTVNGNLTIGDQGSSFGGNTAYLTGNFTQNASISAGTLTLSGATNQTLTQTSGLFSNSLTVAKFGGMALLGSNFTVTGNTTTISGGSIFDLTGYNLTSTTGFVANGTLKLKGTESVTTPTLNAGSTVNYYGTGSAIDLKNWTYANATLVISGAATSYELPAGITAANVTVSGSSTLNLTGSNLTVTSAFTVNSGATLQLRGNETASTPVFSVGSSALFTGDGDGASDTYTVTSLATTYNNLTINATDGTTDTLDLGAALDVNGVFTLSSGTFAQNAYQMNIAGNATIDADAAFTKSTNASKLILDGDLTLELEGSSPPNLGNLQIGTSPDSVTLSGSLVADTLTIATGDTLTTGGYNITTGTGGITNSGTIILTSGAGGTSSVKTSSGVVNHGTWTAGDSALTLSGSFTNNGTFTANTSTVTLDGADQTISGTSSFSTLTVASSSGATLAANQTVTNTLQVNTGSTLTLSTHTLTATTTTITNYGAIAENTGHIAHTPDSFLITDASSNETPSVTAGTAVSVSLNESDENIGGTTADTVTVTLTGSNGESETLTLTETSNTSGIFRGSLPSTDQTVVANNGTFESTDTVWIAATFTDAQDGGIATDEAVFSNPKVTLSGGTGGSGPRGREGAAASPTVNTAARRIAIDHLGNPILTNLLILRDEGQPPDIDALKSTRFLRMRDRLKNDDPVTVKDNDGSLVILADVETVAWYAPFVRRIAEAGIAQGYRGKDDSALLGEFRPARPATAAEVLTMALKAVNADLSSIDGPPRNESAKGTWAAPYVRFAEQNGLSLFTPSFNVHAPVTRGDAVLIVLEVAGIPLIPAPVAVFSDLPQSHPRARAIATAVAYGLLGGDTDPFGIPLHTIRPDDPMNRAEASKVIAGVMGVMVR